MKHLFKSLAAFQQEVPVIHKGTQGFGYSYADLPAIFEKINPLLAKHGLGFTQLLNSKDGENYLVTLVFHIESGENIESQIILPQVTLKGMNDYQSFGSGVTYFRRYALSSALGLVTDKDTDASGEQVKHEPKKPTIDQKRLGKALEAIAEGKYTKDELLSNFSLTDSQIKLLENV
ncbi:MAG: hypothetical protein EBR58_04690 [Betaproteobacteria bacterium]|nr:hypothetical protein [Betaproteobacteria bacterium]